MSNGVDGPEKGGPGEISSGNKEPRIPGSQIDEDIKIIGESPFVDSLMRLLGGALIVLDQNRQVISLNQATFKILGIQNEVVGCRVGEVLNCVNSDGLPNGCGTTKSCRTCGAAIAISACLDSNEPVEKICVVEVEKNEKKSNLFLGVRAAPFQLSGRRYVLLFFLDLSAQQELATLERVFFHDINNILTSLLISSDYLTTSCSGDALNAARIVKRSAENLIKEVAFQRIVSHGKRGDFENSKEEISVHSVLEESWDIVKRHPSSLEKTLSVFSEDQDQTIFSDRYLLVKILTNMLLNAFEATDAGSRVEVRVEYPAPNKTVFAVWNEAVIPEEIQPRIFQKNFSTKKVEGRGLGTYSMKLFGEDILQGEVSFTSKEGSGTTFYFQI